MLAIRLQRRGRKGDAQYRIIVQDARRHPSSGRLVAQLGTFNPNSKQVVLDKDSAATFLKNGAQPSQRAARLLKSEGVKLPSWVNIEKQPKRAIRNPDKLRKNRPAEEAPAAETAPVEEKPAEETAKVTDTPDTAATEATSAEAPVTEPTAEPEPATTPEASDKDK